MHRLLALGGSAWLFAFVLAVMPPSSPLDAHTEAAAERPRPNPPLEIFATSDNCMACHNGLVTPSGEEVSIGTSWRASMMANSSRDPYWQAAVRREVTDHPAAAEEIENECSVCHMPMSHTVERAWGGKGRVFAHLPVNRAAAPESPLARDGVSCTLCHQIRPDALGTPDSLNGKYVIDTKTPIEERPLFGPFAVVAGLTRVMHSATGFKPSESTHVRQSELCATCHTLYTTARGPRGDAIGRLPEQVPFQEWQHSAYRDTRSCQSCHMPVVQEPTPIASVLAEPREGLARHTFVGGNFFVLKMLNRYRGALGVQALPHELEAEARSALQLLRDDTARLTIARTELGNGQLTIDVGVQNLTGHKLPTAYPSRRAWLHLVVRDASNAIVFESGALAASGAIAGNANDEDPSRFEPHYRQITRADQVQIYEPILADAQGRITTGLLTAVRYLKDNRLLPDGFDKQSAHEDIAVHGEAKDDADFVGGADRVQYLVSVGSAAGPFRVEAELLYQPIGFRWANNLRPYDAHETRRFVEYYDTMSAGSAAPLARATARVAVSR